MRVRLIGLTLCVGLVSAVFGASAAAHDPDHHDDARLAFGETLLGSQLDAQLTAAGPAECQDGNVLKPQLGERSKP